ncbi:MAG: hypothetical protein NTAFB09_21390 [Nitrosospira sp.]
MEWHGHDEIGKGDSANERMEQLGQHGCHGKITLIFEGMNKRIGWKRIAQRGGSAIKFGRAGDTGAANVRARYRERANPAMRRR